MRRRQLEAFQIGRSADSTPTPIANQRLRLWLSALLDPELLALSLDVMAALGAMDSEPPPLDATADSVLL